MDIEASNLRKIEKNTLRGFVDIALPSLGLLIRDCTWHTKGDKEWMSWPGKPVIDRDTGKHRVDTATGKPQYANVVEFISREAADKFQAAALAAIRALA